MSRKTLLAILAVITAVLAFFKDQFGLALDPTAVVGGIGAVVLYLLFEAKLEIKKACFQAGKWRDPKFWLALVTLLYTTIGQQFGLKLPLSPELVSTILATVMSVLFAKKFKDEKTA